MALLRPQVVNNLLHKVPRLVSALPVFNSKATLPAYTSLSQEPNISSFRNQRKHFNSVIPRQSWTGTPRTMPLDPSEYVSNIFKDGIFSMTTFLCFFLLELVVVARPETCLHDLRPCCC